MPTTFIGVWFGLAGGLAVLVAVTGRARARRLRREGVKVWGTAIPGTERTLVQYALPDGALVERPARDPLRKSRALLPGQKILVWYDPADPANSVVFGRDGRISDRVLLGVGLVLITLAFVMGVINP
jgi:Protein of unknown function (DUF3592)